MLHRNFQPISNTPRVLMEQLKLLKRTSKEKMTHFRGCSAGPSPAVPWETWWCINSLDNLAVVW